MKGETSVGTENPESKTPESGSRKSRRKHLWGIIPAAAVLLLAGGWFGLTFAVEHAVKRCFADTSSRLIGYEAEAEISCSLLGQELCIEGIHVENPVGYSQESALEVDLIRVQVNPLAFLFGRVIHLKKLTISGVRINVELKRVPMTLGGWLEQIGSPEINLFELKKNASGSERRAVKRKKRSGPRRTKTPLKFRIDELRVEKGAATLQNYKIIPVELRTLTLRSYVQKDLGRDVPLTADELGRDIFNRHREDIKKYLEDLKDKAAAWWKGLFGKKEEKKKEAEAKKAKKIEKDKKIREEKKKKAENGE